MPSLRITVLAAVVTTMLAVTPGHADPAKDKARPHVQAADTSYKLGKFADALAEYNAAYELYPAPAILFNIAQCNRNLKNYEAAIFSFEAYLRANPKAKNARLVLDLIKESRAALEVQKREAAKAAIAEAARAKAQAELDARRAEEERLAQEAEARRKAEEARLAEEQRKAAEIQAGEAEKDRALEMARERTYNRHPARKWAYVGGGIGVATAIVGGVFAFKARSAQSAFDDAGCGDPEVLLSQAELAQCKSDRDSGKRNALLGNVMLGAGAAVIAASALVFIIDPGNITRPKEMSRAQLRISPTSVQVVLRW